jgi:hypothetical protein
MSDPALIDYLAGALAGFIVGLSVAMAVGDIADRRALRRIKEGMKR